MERIISPSPFQAVFVGVFSHEGVGNLFLSLSVFVGVFSHEGVGNSFPTRPSPQKDVIVSYERLQSESDGMYVHTNYRFFWISW